LIDRARKRVSLAADRKAKEIEVTNEIKRSSTLRKKI